MHGFYGLPVNGLFSIPLQVFLTMSPPPDPARLWRLEKGLDEIAREHELSDRETRTLKDGLVEPFRQEGMPIGPDTVQWLQLLNRRLLALPPGVVTAGAELQWTTLGLSRYAANLTMRQYVEGIRSTDKPDAEASAPTPRTRAPRKSGKDGKPKAAGRSKTGKKKTSDGGTV